MPFEFVKVHNTGKKELRFPIPKAPGDRTPAIRWCEIKPGKEQVLSWDAAIGAFGDPHQRDSTGHPERATEHRRLRLQWGFHEGFDTETEELRKTHVNADGIGSWESKRPDFKVTTLDDVYVPMILDDPDGAEPVPNDDGSLPVDNRSAAGASPEMLMAMLAQQNKQIEELRALVVEQSGSSHRGAAETAELPKPPADEQAPKADAPRAPSVKK